MIVIKGIAASPGIAIGKAYVVEDDDIVVERVEISREKVREEVTRFKAAQKATLRDLDTAEGVTAEFALSEALEAVNRQFEKMDDEFFRERRHDLFDVGKRLLLHLMKRQKRSLAASDHVCVPLS